MLLKAEGCFLQLLNSQLVAIALICALPAVPAAIADAPAGHDIAERFAADSERAARQAAERAEQQRQRRIEAEQKRSEAEMLARARAEASAREAKKMAELERLWLKKSAGTGLIARTKV